MQDAAGKQITAPSSEEKNVSSHVANVCICSCRSWEIMKRVPVAVLKYIYNFIFPGEGREKEGGKINLYIKLCT